MIEIPLASALRAQKNALTLASYGLLCRRTHGLTANWQWRAHARIPAQQQLKFFQWSSVHICSLIYRCTPTIKPFCWPREATCVTTTSLHTFLMTFYYRILDVCRSTTPYMVPRLGCATFYESEGPLYDQQLLQMQKQSFFTCSGARSPAWARNNANLAVTHTKPLSIPYQGISKEN